MSISLISLCFVSSSSEHRDGYLQCTRFHRFQNLFLTVQAFRTGAAMSHCAVQPSDYLVIKSHHSRAGQHLCSLSARISQCSEMGGEVADSPQTQRGMANVQMSAASPY